MKRIIANIILGVFTAAVILLGATVVVGLVQPENLGWWALVTLLGSGLALSFLRALENC